MLILHFFLATAGMELFWFYTAAWGPPLELSTAVREILLWPEKGPTGVTGSFSLLKTPANAFTMKNLLKTLFIIYGHLNMEGRCEIRILATKFITARRFCQQSTFKSPLAKHSFEFPLTRGRIWCILCTKLYQKKVPFC